MFCINGSPCLKVTDDCELVYSFGDNFYGSRTWMMWDIPTKEVIMEHINNDLHSMDRALSTEDRLQFSTIIDEWIKEASRKLFVEEAIGDVINKFNHLKMYVVVRSDIGVGHSVNCVGHATNYAEAEWHDDTDYQHWKRFSGRQVTVKANPRLFHSLKEHGDFIIVKEDMLNDVEVAVVYKPREIWPDVFKKLKVF